MGNAPFEPILLHYFFTRDLIWICFNMCCGFSFSNKWEQIRSDRQTDRQTDRQNATYCVRLWFVSGWNIMPFVTRWSLQQHIHNISICMTRWIANDAFWYVVGFIAEIWCHTICKTVPACPAADYTSSSYYTANYHVSHRSHVARTTVTRSWQSIIYNFISSYYPVGRARPGQF